MRWMRGERLKDDLSGSGGMLWVTGIDEKNAFALKHIEFEVHPGKTISR